MATILVVDERPLDREFLAALLSRSGHRVLEATDTQAALALVRAEKPALLITDLVPQGQPAAELAARLCAGAAESGTRLVFFTAACRTPEARTVAASYPLSVLLPRPSPPEAILGTVRDLLDPPPRDIADGGASLGAAPMGSLAGQLSGCLADIGTVRGLIAGIIESGPVPPGERDALRVALPKLAGSLDRMEALGRRLTTLIELGLELASRHDTEHLLGLFCGAIRKICEARYAVVGLLDEEGERLLRLHTHGLEHGVVAPGDFHLRPGSFPLRLVAERRPLRLAGLGLHPAAWGLPATHPPVHSLLGLPIVSPTRLYGWVYLADKQGAPEFSALDEDLAATMTAQMALAYENLEFYRELQRRAAALQAEIAERRQAQESLRKILRARAVMAECNHALVHETEENELYERMCRIIVETGNYPVAWIGVVRGDKYRTLAPVAHAGNEAGRLKEWRFTREDTERCRTPAGLAIRSGQAVVVPDLNTAEGWCGWREHILEQGYRSVLVLPLRENAHVFGTLSIYDVGPASFGPDEVRLLEDLADDFAYGVDNLRTQGARERAERRLATQYEVARLLAESATLVEAAPKILQVICESLNWDVDLGELWVAEPAARRLRCSGIWLRDETEAPGSEQARHDRSVEPGEGLPERVWKAGESVWIADLAREPGFVPTAFPARLGLHAAFGFPIRFEGRVLGVVGVYSQEIRKPKEDLLNLFTAVGSQIGLFMERKRAEEELRVSEEKLSSILGSIDNIVWSLCPGTGEMFYLNAAAEKVWGRPVADFMSDKNLWLRSVHPDDRERMRRSLDELLEQGVLTTQYRILRPDGEIRWLEDRVKVVHDQGGSPARLDGVATDITERKQYEASIEYLATHDALTRLPNRTLLADRLHQALAHAKRTGRPLALFFLDLDRFKDVNDSFGHALGDALLQAVAGRLLASVREGDTVARQGGDEFLILLSDLERMEDIEPVAHKIQRAMSQPFVIEGRELFIGGSIGASVYPADGEDMETLLKHADTAMYRAKEEGGAGFRLYAREMSHRAVERIRMENALRKAAEQGQFELYYQPKVELAGGRIIGAEALIRWRHPELGLVLPTRFIPLAEETGLIHGIGRWVLEAACLQSKAWQEAGLAACSVAVNLSARQLRGGNLVNLVGQTLREVGLEGSHLELELTETLVMQDPEHFIPILGKLKDLGVGLSVDDFGTGYSSLSYLKRFPFDCLKIDQSFVRDIATDNNDAVIVRSVISLGHSLGLKVIAEGVETEEQLLFLCRHRCDDMQGYYSGRPLPAGEFARLLREGRRLALPEVECGDEPGR
jgi:diguanylate cyclase (GGDEF)-like protein/PAS domain S-box-containing protein